MHFFKFNQVTSYNIIYKGVIPFYLLCVIMLHTAYFLNYFQVISIPVEYIDSFNIFIQVFICLFLIIKFFPFVDHVFYKQDSIIIFGCALFLLFHIGFGKLIDTKILHRPFFVSVSSSE